jgi:hypothetical protein
VDGEEPVHSEETVKRKVKIWSWILIVILSSFVWILPVAMGDMGGPYLMMVLLAAADRREEPIGLVVWTYILAPGIITQVLSAILWYQTFQRFRVLPLVAAMMVAFLPTFFSGAILVGVDDAIVVWWERFDYPEIGQWPEICAAEGYHLAGDPHPAAIAESGHIWLSDSYTRELALLTVPDCRVERLPRDAALPERELLTASSIPGNALLRAYARGDMTGRVVWRVPGEAELELTRTPARENPSWALSANGQWAAWATTPRDIRSPAVHIHGRDGSMPRAIPFDVRSDSSIRILKLNDTGRTVRLLINWTVVEIDETGKAIERVEVGESCGGWPIIAFARNGWVTWSLDAWERCPVMWQLGGVSGSYRARPDRSAADVAVSPDGRLVALVTGKGGPMGRLTADALSVLRAADSKEVLRVHLPIEYGRRSLRVRFLTDRYLAYGADRTVRVLRVSE